MIDLPPLSLAALQSPPPPAIASPLAQEVSFGRIRGRAGAGTVRIVVSAGGKRLGEKAVGPGAFAIDVTLPRRDVTVAVTAVDAAGNRSTRRVGPVFGLPSAAAPRAIRGVQDRRLAKVVRRLVRSHPGTEAVFVQDLATGRGAAWNALARFPAASTLKLGIAVELLRRLGSRPLPVTRLGALFRRMLVSSDNEAANALLTAIGGSTSGGAAAVNTTLRRLGLLSSHMYGGYLVGSAGRRGIPLGVVSQPDFGVGKHTTAWDLARLHRYLHRATAGQGPLPRLRGFTSADARYLLYTLVHVRDRGKLDRYIRRPNVAVPHKAGWIRQARHDSGIVYWRRGGFTAVVMTWRPAGAGVSADILAGRVARASLRRLRVVPGPLAGLSRDLGTHL